tara:strand:- start:12353 stop:14494 length:2142 start_codon:yes stop_codon:yes gene_type:complete
MTLLRNAIDVLTKAHDRLPMTGATSRIANFAMGGGRPQTPALGQMSASGWLFATVDRIATAVSASEWSLQRKQGNEMEDVADHPLLSLWERPNPFYTQSIFLETWDQHFELTGEMFGVILRDDTIRMPREIWPLRPDRMIPIPNREGFILGYVYQLGSEKIPLAAEDVIFIRRPSPLDPFRGIGVIASLLLDLESEKMAAQWTRQFFQNSAEPGGVIEMTDALSDDEFDKMVARWQQQHQGVGNAHRVAILEGGVWKDRKYSQRDMQFEQLRRLNRDLIIGAFGVPLPLLGITENVNRANAEAAEVMFSRFTVWPRLRRIRDALNAHLAPMFFDATLRLVVQDPTPANQELNLDKAERGFNAGIVTLNEARGIMGYGEVDDGDDFKAPAASPFAMALPEAPVRRALPASRHNGRSDATTAKADPLLAEEVEQEEKIIDDAWNGRLYDEAEAIAEYVEEFMKSMPNAWHGGAIVKIEPSDLDGYDWDWWTKYGDDVVEELTSLFATSILDASPEIGATVAQKLAVEYAEARGARLIRLDGDLNLVKLTRDRVNKLVATTIEEGQSLGQLQKALREDFAFSRSRATNIARTETATALGDSAQKAAIIDGRNEKQWVTQGDDTTDDICMGNAAAGWIKVGDPFPSGDDVVPAHPQCRCVNIYRTAEADETLGFESRCEHCDKLLAKRAIGGQPTYCGRCRKEVMPVVYEQRVEATT